MEGYRDISDELKLISELVAGISRLNPYDLPEAYFADLADRLLLRVKTGDPHPIAEFIHPGFRDASSVPESLRSAVSQSAYSIPEGYFEAFSGKLMDRIKNGSSLNADRSLNADQAGESRFSKATNTDDLVDSPQRELSLLSPLLSKIDRRMPFVVPGEYFTELSDAVAANVAYSSRLVDPKFEPSRPEIEFLSATLSGLKDKSVYQAPADYFESLSDRVLAVLIERALEIQSVSSGEQPELIQSVSDLEPETAKIVSLNRVRSWWKYSAAAVVTLLILTGGWLWSHTSSRTGPGAAGAEVAQTLPTVSDQDIENYLDTNNVTNNVPVSDDFANSTAYLDITDNDIKSFLGDVPDGELKQYIDEHGDVQNLGTN